MRLYFLLLATLYDHRKEMKNHSRMNSSPVLQKRY